MSKRRLSDRQKDRIQSIQERRRQRALNKNAVALEEIENLNKEYKIKVNILLETKRIYDVINKFSYEVITLFIICERSVNRI